MHTGFIKRLNEKGFGFIGVAGRAKDLFFHAKQIVGFTFSDLKEGDEVSFDEIRETPKGDSAVGVRLIIK